jgi:hypothetical protein
MNRVISGLGGKFRQRRHACYATVAALRGGLVGEPV